MMKYLIMGLALIAAISGGAAWFLYSNNADLRDSNTQIKQQADKDVALAQANADGWKRSYGEQVMSSAQDNALQSSLIALGDSLREGNAANRQTYLSFLKGQRHDPSACINQPVPPAVYDRIGLRESSQTYPASSSSNSVPDAAGKSGASLPNPNAPS
jgi:hypothetical protein